MRAYLCAGHAGGSPAFAHLLERAAHFPLGKDAQDQAGSNNIMSLMVNIGYLLSIKVFLLDNVGVKGSPNLEKDIA
jgi:hypothetical protein